MKHIKSSVLFSLILLLLSGAPCVSYAEVFDAQVHYSHTLLDARLNSWYNKDKKTSFNGTNGKTATWDYVPGLVATGVLYVCDYHFELFKKYDEKQREEEQEQENIRQTYEWFNTISTWALGSALSNDGKYANITKTEALDDLNCAKPYMSLYNYYKAEAAKAEAADAKAAADAAAAQCFEVLQNAAIGLNNYNTYHSIKKVNETVNGGWYHKAEKDSYEGQMWCDGAYMGPALLAQLLAFDSKNIKKVIPPNTLGWEHVVKQFTASWPYLWDPNEKLLYHAMFTDVETNDNARKIKEERHAYEWVNTIEVKDDNGNVVDTKNESTGIYHSEEYWGRANGWYILALVDVLEAMETYGKTVNSGDPDFIILRDYLEQLAEGLVARQDASTGCWYQLLKYKNERKCEDPSLTGSLTNCKPEEGVTCFSNPENQANYLESSASCLITAALLKAVRLGYLPTKYRIDAIRAYKGIISQFYSKNDSPNSDQLTTSCESAGLSSDRWGTAEYYLRGRDVEIKDNTEGKVFGPFLMAAVEYERAQGCDCLKVTVKER